MSPSKFWGQTLPRLRPSPAITAGCHTTLKKGGQCNTLWYKYNETWTHSFLTKCHQQSSRELLATCLTFRRKVTAKVIQHPIFKNLHCVKQRFGSVPCPFFFLQLDWAPRAHQWFSEQWISELSNSLIQYEDGFLSPASDLPVLERLTAVTETKRRLYRSVTIVTDQKLLTSHC